MVKCVIWFMIKMSQIGSLGLFESEVCDFSDSLEVKFLIYVGFPLQLEVETMTYIKWNSDWKANWKID